MILLDLIRQSARTMPDAMAVVGSDGGVTYAFIDALSERFAYILARSGVHRGDRVGIWLEKSALAIAAMQGTLRLGAIYVPLDPLSPVARIHTIICDCTIKLLVTVQQRAANIADQSTCFFYVDSTECADLLFHDAWPGEGVHESICTDVASGADDVVYILYTSGSTGRPKGVCISNTNALAFIDWAADLLHATSADRFANHAPFHFDLSVLDIYVPFKLGASVHLIADNITYIPIALINFLRYEEPTIWYSVPSVLVLMMDQGNLLALPSLSLRVILFAGEPFPIRHLCKLYQRWSGIRLLNLYGPTETNVCTFFEVTEIGEYQTVPVPIGKACCGDEVWVLKDNGTLALVGEIGELMVRGPTVMVGYWGQPALTSKVYATGDLVQLQEDGNYAYLGRRDHMVKVRGYRVESGDIEVALQMHPSIHEVAVKVSGEGINARLVAYIVPAAAYVPSLLEVKRYCAERLPRYMVIDDVCILAALPRTRNGKIDRMALNATNIDGITD
jgi:amino acid adenylation domain-containing protein